MYRIGVVNFEGNTSEWEQLQTIIPSEWTLIPIVEDSKDRYDLIIIVENSLKQVGEICGQLIQVKKEADSLIWIWSVVQNEMNRMVYLKLGADGVKTDSLKLEEWLLVAENALKRKKIISNLQTEKTVQESRCEGIVLNHRNRSVVVNETEEVQLTNLEYKAMDLLFKNMGKTVTYEEMYQVIWEEEESTERKFYRISNLIFHIRQKFIQETSATETIRTVRSKGYVLNV
ncbi:hypothetical protein A5819_001357 [Enterococcus sp. 7E2_DIV0204]|uniref:winged helix-turn-helix domain-containing protein n=1 Tax=unclassified Enterococcus TaxID=2608891 RepID=UPI000A35399E|nr:MULTISPECIES: winged helix-turn-helix domain-containing protein [unclassified Enterococcus]OTN88865.1 hypothetical protein A5819_001357 [Enterococcus sp. 7E2_DIV0204]OTP51331.1 hypothetical protein A5884_000526 [Enterococcus sp. 7D2_DIV0200]